MELKKPPIRPPTSSNLITNKLNSNNTDTLINKNKLDDELIKQTITKPNNDTPNKTVTKNISARPNSAILLMTQSKPNLPLIKSNIGIAKPNLPPSKLTGNKSNLSDSNSSISTSSQSKTTNSKLSGIHPPKRINKTDNTSILLNKHSKITNIATTKLSRSGSGVDTGTRSGIYPPKRTNSKSLINTQNLKSTKIFSGSGNVIHPPSDLLVTVTTKDKTTNVLTNNKTDCVISPQTNILQNSRLQEKNIKNNNNLQNQTMSLTDALAEIEKLKEQLEIKKLVNYTI